MEASELHNPISLLGPFAIVRFWGFGVFKGPNIEYSLDTNTLSEV